MAKEDTQAMKNKYCPIHEPATAPITSTEFHPTGGVAAALMAAPNVERAYILKRVQWERLEGGVRVTHELHPAPGPTCLVYRVAPPPRWPVRLWHYLTRPLACPPPTLPEAPTTW